ncbi:MAG: PxKF domain-containing protein [Candidatus Beckwithbacteria bacterium]
MLNKIINIVCLFLLVFLFLFADTKVYAAGEWWGCNFSSLPVNSSTQYAIGYEHVSGLSDFTVGSGYENPKYYIRRPLSSPLWSGPYQWWGPKIRFYSGGTVKEGINQNVAIAPNWSQSGNIEIAFIWQPDSNFSLDRVEFYSSSPGAAKIYIRQAGSLNTIIRQCTITADTIPPTTTVLLSGTMGDNNWYTSDVQVTLSAADNPGGSGLLKTEYSFNGTSWVTYTTPFSLTTEGETTVYYRSTDNSSNVEATKTQIVKIDKTAPVIIGVATTVPNTDNWHKTDVVVHFTAEDLVSGIETVTPDITLSAEGQNQTVAGTATDKAGNSASTMVSGINIDKTAPSIVINVPENQKSYLLNENVLANWTVEDVLSQIESSSGTVPSGSPIDTVTVGEKTFTVTAKDKADNETTKTVTYRVQYNFEGFLPPIMDKKENKLGSTIPVKFRLKDALGNYFATAVARLFLIDANGNETEATSNTNDGNLFRYDTTDNLYIYNLKTKGLTVGQWQVKAVLNDGTIHSASITLR